MATYKEVINRNSCLSGIAMVLALINLLLFVVYVILGPIFISNNASDIDSIESTISQIQKNISNGGGGGGSQHFAAAVYIPMTGLGSSGGFLYAELGPPEDLVGTRSSNVTVQSSSPAGDEVLVSSDVFAVIAEFNTQYSTQSAGGSSRRTFHILQFDGIGVVGSASGIPRPSNNWRISSSIDGFGLDAGSIARALLTSNAVGPVTLNSGSITLIFL